MTGVSPGAGITVAPAGDIAPGADLVAAGAAAVAASGPDVVAQARTALRWGRRQFGARLVVASSMGDEALVHLASEEAPGVEVLFLDTGYHFAQTLATVAAVGERYRVDVRAVHPVLSVAEQDDRYGKELIARDPDRCCALRKVEPLQRGLAGYAAWVTGIRRADATTRARAEVIEWDASRGLVKINPLAAWSDAELRRFESDHQVLLNPLRELGFASIGCRPCTRPVAPGEDPRSGRWSGTVKTECGLHT